MTKLAEKEAIEKAKFVKSKRHLAEKTAAKEANEATEDASVAAKTPLLLLKLPLAAKKEQETKSEAPLDWSSQFLNTVKPVKLIVIYKLIKF